MKKVVLFSLLAVLFISGCGASSENDGSDKTNSDAPVLNTIGNKTVTVGETVAFTVSATDPNDLALSYATDGSVGTNDNPYTETFNVATFNTMTRQFSWNTTGVTPGDYYIEFSVMNSVALEDFETVRIRIQSATTGNDEYSIGRDLYLNNCAGSGCHKNEENNTGGFTILCSSTATIKSATESPSGNMPPITLSADQEAAISNYLNNVKPELCN